MSELFTHDPEEFQNTLRNLPYGLRFQIVKGLTDLQRSALATNWEKPEHDNVFHKICLPGSKELYFITDTLSSNPSDSNSNMSVFGLWKDEQSITHRSSQEVVIRAIKEADSTMAVFGLRRDGHFPQHSISQPSVIESMKQNATDNKIVTLDVGSGSGISAIIMQSYLAELEIQNFETIGVDLNPRAIDFGRRNNELNDLPAITWKNEIYNINSAPLKSCNIIHLNPPYNPRPSFLAPFTPKFADGWSEDATANFKSQISIAYQHLAQDGIMVINMMSPNSIADPNKSLAVEFIQNLDPTMSIECVEVYPPISSGDFLNGTFDPITDDVRDVDPKRVKQIVKFQNRINRPGNKFHYNIIIAKNDGKSEFRKITDHSFAKYNWECRVENHSFINKGSKQRLIDSIAAQRSSKF
jgi:ribosomal protein L11 methylase PrmA